MSKDVMEYFSVRLSLQLCWWVSSYNPSPPSRERKKGNVLESARWATLFPELSVVLNPHSARLSLHIKYDTPI